MRQSTQDNWRALWTKRDIDEVYPTSEILVENLIKFVNVKGLKILEVGAGSGRDSIRLAKMGAQVYVLDYINESLQVIRSLARRENLVIHCILADARMLPIQTDRFDVVFHQGLLEHFREPDDQLLVEENYRILKTGGVAVIDVPQTFHIYTVIKHLLILFNKWFAGWEKQFTPSQLRRLLKRVNLSVVHQYGEWMYPSLFYRVFREICWKLHIVKLPLYPPTVPVLHELRKRIRNFLLQSSLTHWTTINIGMIARKNQIQENKIA